MIIVKAQINDHACSFLHRQNSNLYIFPNALADTAEVFELQKHNILLSSASTAATQSSLCPGFALKTETLIPVVALEATIHLLFLVFKDKNPILRLLVRDLNSSLLYKGEKKLKLLKFSKTDDCNCSAAAAVEVVFFVEFLYNLCLKCFQSSSQLSHKPATSIQY